MFGKAKHWRMIELEKIEGVEFLEFQGFKIAKLDTTNNAGETISFCIPWSDSFDELIELHWP